MRGFGRVFNAEVRKVHWLLMLALLAVAPALGLLLQARPVGMKGFERFYMGATITYGWLFFPIVSGIVAALICRPEHLAGGWKQLFSLPVRRWQVYVAKYLIVIALLGVSQLMLGAGLVAGALAWGFTPILWKTMLTGLFAGWIAVMPLAALQMWVSSRWRSFGAPLALNVALTFPAIFAVQSEKFAPWYPWGQPVLGMMSPLSKVPGPDAQWLAFSPQTLLVVIVGGLALWLTLGLVDFSRADVLA